jgi:hypothetical protein
MALRLEQPSAPSTLIRPLIQLDFMPYDASPLTRQDTNLPGESHDFMKLIYRKKAVEAGGEANIEPSTYKLLEEQFPADILRLAFPKCANQEAKRMASSMRSLLMKWVRKAILSIATLMKQQIYQDN